MIIEYHRPENVNEALALLGRSTPVTFPLGGGTVLSRMRKDDIAVVDLQILGLDYIQPEVQLLCVGATATIQALLDFPGLPEGSRDALINSLRHETGHNIRQVATIAGIIASSDGRSPFVTALLAMDPRLVWAPGDEHQPLGDFLPLREEFCRGRMIVEVRIPVNVSLRFDMIARSPMDRPIVCAAVATWPSGRTRIALGGHGVAPILAMDGPEPGGAVVAAREAYHFASDQWASADYRMEIAGKLVQRMLHE